MNTVIRKGLVFFGSLDAAEYVDLYIRDEKIVAIGDEPPEDFVCDQEINAEGLWVFPGLVDIAVHLREPGAIYRANIASETTAALASGITTLGVVPAVDTPLDTAADVRLTKHINSRHHKIHLSIIGAMTVGLRGNHLTEMAALKQEGCVGVSNSCLPMQNTRVLRTAMEYAATHDLTVFLCPLDHALAENGCAHEGRVASRLGLPGIPVAAETAALGQMIALVEETGARTHFCRLSTADSIRHISRAKADRLPISSDVAIHQLFLTEMDISEFNPLCRTLPPLRTERDRDALREAVANGVIDAICSDHQPHDIDAKLAPFQQAQAGISGLESLLALTLRLVEEGVFSHEMAIKRISSEAAHVLGSEVGLIAVGRPADLCLYDPKQFWDVDIENETWLSHGKNTPFQHWSFTGKVVRTILRGRTVYPFIV